MPNPRPRFADRIVVVACTWTILSLIALYVGPQIALAAAILPLSWALRSAWNARAEGRWDSEEHRLRRQVTAIAMLMAAGLFAATFWSLRHVVGPWVIPMEIGLLLHYWLLTLS
jgi:hypothetical protein